MPLDDLDRKLAEVSSRVVSAWIKEENRMAVDGEPLFRPLITWPEGTEYLQKVSLPDEEQLEDKLTRAIHDVFSRYDLEANDEMVDELIEYSLKNQSP